MPIKSIFGKRFYAIKRSLEITKERNGLITSNIGKLNTQDDRTKGIAFKNVLKNAMEGTSVDLHRTNLCHFSSKVSYPEPSLSGIKSVDIDKEMSKLTENNLRYRASAESLLRKLSKLKFAVTEVGR